MIEVYKIINGMEKMCSIWMLADFFQIQVSGPSDEARGSQVQNKQFTQQAVNLGWTTLWIQQLCMGLEGGWRRIWKRLPVWFPKQTKPPHPILREVPDACVYPGALWLPGSWLGVGWTMAARPCYCPPWGAYGTLAPGSHQPWWHHDNGL